MNAYWGYNLIIQPSEYLLTWSISLAGWFDWSNEQIWDFSSIATIWVKMPITQNYLPRKFQISFSSKWAHNEGLTWFSSTVSICSFDVYHPSMVSWYEWLSEEFKVRLIIIQHACMFWAQFDQNQPLVLLKWFIVVLFQWFSNINNTKIQLYCCKSLEFLFSDSLHSAVQGLLWGQKLYSICLIKHKFK